MNARRRLEPGDPIHSATQIAGVSGERARELLDGYAGDDPKIRRELQVRARRIERGGEAP